MTFSSGENSSCVQLLHGKEFFIALDRIAITGVKWNVQHATDSKVWRGVAEGGFRVGA